MDLIIDFDVEIKKNPNYNIIFNYKTLFKNNISKYIILNNNLKVEKTNFKNDEELITLLNNLNDDLIMNTVIKKINVFNNFILDILNIKDKKINLKNIHNTTSWKNIYILSKKCKLREELIKTSKELEYYFKDSFLTESLSNMDFSKNINFVYIKKLFIILHNKKFTESFYSLDIEEQKTYSILKSFTIDKNNLEKRAEEYFISQEINNLKYFSVINKFTEFSFEDQDTLFVFLYNWININLEFVYISYFDIYRFLDDIDKLIKKGNSMENILSKYIKFSFFENYFYKLEFNFYSQDFFKEELDEYKK